MKAEEPKKSIVEPQEVAASIDDESSQLKPVEPDQSLKSCWRLLYLQMLECDQCMSGLIMKIFGKDTWTTLPDPYLLDHDLVEHATEDKDRDVDYKKYRVYLLLQDILAYACLYVDSFKLMKKLFNTREKLAEGLTELSGEIQTEALDAIYTILTKLGEIPSGNEESIRILVVKTASRDGNAEAELPDDGLRAVVKKLGDTVGANLPKQPLDPTMMSTIWEMWIRLFAGRIPTYETIGFLSSELPRVPEYLSSAGLAAKPPEDFQYLIAYLARFMQETFTDMRKEALRQLVSNPVMPSVLSIVRRLHHDADFDQFAQFQLLVYWAMRENGRLDELYELIPDDAAGTKPSVEGKAKTLLYPLGLAQGEQVRVSLELVMKAYLNRVKTVEVALLQPGGLDESVERLGRLPI